MGPAAAPWLMSGHSAERCPGHCCPAGRVINRVLSNAPEGPAWHIHRSQCCCHLPLMSLPASGLHNTICYQWSKSIWMELCIPEAITFHANLQAPPGCQHEQDMVLALQEKQYISATRCGFSSSVCSFPDSTHQDQNDFIRRDCFLFVLSSQHLSPVGLESWQ